jgi:hypothetical protein
MVVEEAEEPVQLSALSVRKANASRASGPDMGRQRAASAIDELVVVAEVVTAVRAVSAQMVMSHRLKTVSAATAAAPVGKISAR